MSALGVASGILTAALPKLGTTPSNDIALLATVGLALTTQTAAYVYVTARTKLPRMLRRLMVSSAIAGNTAMWVVMTSGTRRLALADAVLVPIVATSSVIAGHSFEKAVKALDQHASVRQAGGGIYEAGVET
jgi:hypothetical protein